jgi:hypothetical protein
MGDMADYFSEKAIVLYHKSSLTSHPYYARALCYAHYKALKIHLK